MRILVQGEDSISIAGNNRVQYLEENIALEFTSHQGKVTTHRGNHASRYSFTYMLSRKVLEHLKSTDNHFPVELTYWFYSSSFLYKNTESGNGDTIAQVENIASYRE